MRVILASTALLALPSMINAVALSAMAPYAKNLPPACQSLYTAQIPGCDANDFKTGQCSSSCQSALQALVQPILKACGGQGVTGQNLIVAYLAGLGPQQLCRNLGSTATTSEESTTSTMQQWTTTSQQTSTSTPKPTIVSSTSTAESAKETTSLIADTSSSLAVAKTTSTKQKTTARSTSSSSTSHTSSSKQAVQTSTKSSSTSSTSTTTGAGNSQTNLSDGSGGGSPFDTAGNLINSAAGLSASGLSVCFSALAAALFIALR